jgi:hypothetical protein
MAAVPTGKPRRINGSYGNILVCGVEPVHRFSEGDPKIQGFTPTEKFLERGEMRNIGEAQTLPDRFHIPDILNKFPVMLVAIILE